MLLRPLRCSAVRSERYICAVSAKPSAANSLQSAKTPLYEKTAWCIAKRRVYAEYTFQHTGTRYKTLCVTCLDGTRPSTGPAPLNKSSLTSLHLHISRQTSGMHGVPCRIWHSMLFQLRNCSEIKFPAMSACPTVQNLP